MDTGYADVRRDPDVLVHSVHVWYVVDGTPHDAEIWRSLMLTSLFAECMLGMRMRGSRMMRRCGDKQH